MMQRCRALGGALLLQLLTLLVAACSGAAPLRPVEVPTATARVAPTDAPPYHRRDWKHWIDVDRDCQDTRQEVLVAESEVPVEFTDSRNCRVKRGRWTCAYTGKVTTDPRELDVDHFVPLENAHRSGGWAWSARRKEAFANELHDPDHLVAVLASANRAKGSKGPEEWLPRDAAFVCAYVYRWKEIKNRWGLTMGPAEQSQVRDVMAKCRTHANPGGMSAAGTSWSQR